MNIESALHYAGTRELARRLEDAIEQSRTGMRLDDFKFFEAEMRKRIASLEESMEIWRNAENFRVMSHSWFELELTSDGIQKISQPHCLVRKQEIRVRQPAPVVKMKRPAFAAGLSIVATGYLSACPA
jgi:hypothetical protein